MNIEHAPSPTADPALNGPQPDRWESAAQIPGDAAAERELERHQVDEMSAIALDLLRVLRIEVLDPDHAPTDIPGTRVRATDPTLAYVRLTRSVRLNLGVRARMAADDAETGIVEPPEAAALRCRREQQTVIEMSAIGMDLLRVLQQEVLDSYLAPTQGQGLLVGAGDPARALEQLTRAVRLNHAIRAKIADGSLGRKRRARVQAPVPPAQERVAQQPPARPQVVTPDCDHDAMEAEHDGIKARLREIALEVGIEADEAEIDIEHLFLEFDEDLTEALEEDPDEFEFMRRLSPPDAMALARREFDRCIRLYGRRGNAAPSGPPYPDGPANNAEHSNPTEQQSPARAALDLPARQRDGLDPVPRPVPTLGDPRKPGGDAPAAPAHPLRPPGRDPP